MTTRLLLRLFGESSHPAMTRLPIPFRWGLIRPGTTRYPPPSPWRVDSSGDNSTPPTPWRPLPGFPSTPEASRPPSSLSTPWGLGSTPEASRPPEFPLTPQGSAPSHPRRPPFFPLALTTPRGGPASPPVGRCGGAFPAVASASPRIPQYPSLPAFLCVPWRRHLRGVVPLLLLHICVRCCVAPPALSAPSLASGLPFSPPPHLSWGPAAARPPPRAPAPGPGRQYCP